MWIDTYFSNGGWIISGVIVLIIAEILFLTDKSKPRKNQSTFWFTFGEKLQAVGIAFVMWEFIFLSYGVGAILTFYPINLALSIPKKYLIYFAIGIFSIFLFLIYIKLNSLKFRKNGRRR